MFPLPSVEKVAALAAAAANLHIFFRTLVKVIYVEPSTKNLVSDEALLFLIFLTMRFQRVSQLLNQKVCVNLQTNYRTTSATNCTGVYDFGHYSAS
jgi:hypothetical protein